MSILATTIGNAGADPPSATGRPSTAGGFNLRLWAILLSTGVAGAAAVLPYGLELAKSMPLPAEQPPLPLPLIIALSLLQNSVLIGLAVWGGLVFAQRAGLPGAPLLAAGLNGQRPDVRRALASGAGIGLLAGSAMTAADVLLFAGTLPQSVIALLEAPLWKRLLAGVFYGGITEELLLRLFMVSGLACLLGLAFRSDPARGRRIAAAGAVVLAALLFGLGHLPATAALATLTPELVARALLLNGIAGLAFGWLYIRWGVESAMLGHAAAHLILQLPGAWLVLNTAQHLR
jgi:hypothetical protein